MDKSTLELLELFNTHSSLSLTQLSAILNIDYFDISNPVHYLMDQKYIQKNNAALLEKLEGNILSPSTTLEITYAGRIAIHECKKENRRYKYVELRAWITLLIAVLAFIKSFFF